jgi:hypothetical protein
MRCNNKILSDRLRCNDAGGLSRWVQSVSALMRNGACQLARLLLVFSIFLIAQPAQAAKCSPPSAPATPLLSTTLIAKPAYPVIFIHGINSNANDTWGDFRSDLFANGWTYGGIAIPKQVGCVGPVQSDGNTL